MAQRKRLTVNDQAAEDPGADTTWPAFRVEPKSIDSLHPNPHNARTHTDEQVAQLARAIEEFGWTNPIVATPQGMILAGHGRWAAARLLGYTEVPVAVADKWTDEQQLAYGLSDNRLAELAGWDESLLAAQLSELQGRGVDLDLVGFTEKDLKRMLKGLGGGGNTDPDEVPEPPAEPVSRRGDVWILGGHVVCPECGGKTATDVAVAGTLEVAE